MPDSLTRAILRDHLVEGELRPGEPIGLRVDQTLLQDATGTMTARVLTIAVKSTERAWVVPSASLILSRCWPQKKLSLLVTIGLTGMLGTLLATPGLLLVEEFFPEEIDEEWLDVFGQRGWWQALLAEYLQVLPKLLPTWYLINLPLLFNKPVLNPLPPSEEPDGPPPGEQARREEEMRQRREQLYQKLPEVIGRDIVAISSDLHYLNIHTVLGKILVLGSLKHYVEAFGDEGLLVHRSNWVAKRHVVKVRTSGDEAYCLMSNGLKVPISRSRKKEVKAIFGDFVRAPQERRLTVVK